MWRLQDTVAEERLKFTGHILSMSNDKHAKRTQKWTRLNKTRKRRRSQEFKKEFFLINLD